MKAALLVALLSASVSAFAVNIVPIENPSLNIDRATYGKVYRAETTGYMAFDMPEGFVEQNQFDIRYTGQNHRALNRMQTEALFAGRGFAPEKVGSVQEMIRAVASTPNGVGYAPDDSLDSSVKIITQSP